MTSPQAFDGLRAAGVKLTANEEKRAEVDGVAGKTFVITGTLPTLGRTGASVSSETSDATSKKTLLND